MKKSQVRVTNSARNRRIIQDTLAQHWDEFEAKKMSKAEVAARLNQLLKPLNITVVEGHMYTAADAIGKKWWTVRQPPVRPAVVAHDAAIGILARAVYELAAEFDIANRPAFQALVALTTTTNPPHPTTSNDQPRTRHILNTGEFDFNQQHLGSRIDVRG